MGIKFPKIIMGPLLRMVNKVWRVKCYRMTVILISIPVVLLIIDLSGLFRHLREKSYEADFSYPLESPNFVETVNSYRLGKNVIMPPINTLYSSFNINQDSFEKCLETQQLSLLILVKSAPKNLRQRQAIRETWKASALEYNTKVAFFVGIRTSDTDQHDEQLKNKLVEESNSHKDIVQLEFMDSYYNNTIKTMLEMRWAVEMCSNFDYALLIDDDYFLSVKNLLRFIDSPAEYPSKTGNGPSRSDAVLEERLYAGYRMFPPPHRHKIFTKWFVPLDEYPFDYFPPYITAGAILLSNRALVDIYYASFYTVHFRFDDIYVAICAKKMNITPVNSEYFRFWSTRDDSPEEHLVASHGFSDAHRLHAFWQTQKSHGYC